MVPTTMEGTMLGVKTRKQTLKQVRPSLKTSNSRHCRHCGAEVEANAEFCPYCGKKLVDYCTFCGAPMSPDETVCDECGMSASGVHCPQCGTLNMRPFCRHCNTPLTKAAIRAIEKAKQDPKVQKAAALMDRAAELEAVLEGDKVQTTEAEQRLQEILGGQVDFTAAEPDATQAAEEYRQVVKDINQLFEEMLPPAGSTPQEQYNYYSARKVAVESMRRVVRQVKTGWVCNYCGCFHNQPSECVEPWHGGTWIYRPEVVEEIGVEYKYEE